MGKARDGSECYTRQNKSGGNYVTCEGSQQKSAARQKPKPVISERPAGRIDTGTLNPGKVVTDFDASAIVYETPGVVGMTMNYPPGIDKGFFFEAMEVVTNQAKDTGKTTTAQMDARMKLDKKARLGKLTKKELVEYLENTDEDWDETLSGNIDDRLESYSYNPDYWISRVSKRAEYWDDLTDTQNERLQQMQWRSAHSDQRGHITEEFNKSIKGQKFKSLGDATTTFKTSLEYYFK
jgi:hypothetical protein